MSASPELDELLAHLRGVSKDIPLAQALANFGPAESAARVEARRRCALVRTLDRDIYQELTRDLDGSPSLDELLDAHEVRSIGPERWVLVESSRGALLRDWQSTQNVAEWKKWNQRLANFFMQRGPAGRLDALYHFAASPDPAEVSNHLDDWYRQADEQFDLAQCNALLEVLRIQEAWRGGRLSQGWQYYRQYYLTRQYFSDDYFKTGAYFQRKGPYEAFEPLLGQDAGEWAAPRKWVFHIHATGGTGKTIFLRWLVSRVLVPRRIPCARIDLDEVGFSELVANPGSTLFARMIEQWAIQVPQLTALGEKLQRELELPGWNTSVTEEIGRQLRGAQLQTEMVVILDTLEDVTRTAKDWLENCMQSLRRVRESYPKLIVVLSGRYDISQLTTALIDGEYIAHDLQRFTEDEAHAYLESRGIPPGDARDAIVERSGEVGEGEEEENLSGRNPFTLAMFAALALNRAGLTAAAVWKMQRVDIAYLLERVIMRIESQALRWAIRYGVVVRHLTREVIEGVLLPAFKDALQDEAIDDLNKQMGEEFDEAWVRDASLAATITAEGIWTELKGYARKNGWVDLIGDEANGTAELRFHPDVVGPTRALLRGQAIYRELQRRAADFFHERSGLGGTRLPPADSAQVLRDACEAVFQRFQLDGPAARDFWHGNLRLIEQAYGADAAATYAAEITGSGYARQQVEPVAGVTDAVVLREAHCETADLLLQQRPLDQGWSDKTTAELLKRVDWASAVAGRNHLPAVPLYLTAIRAMAGPTYPNAVSTLEAALGKTSEPRERVFLLAALALVERGSTRTSARRYEDLLAAMPAPRVGFKAFDVALELADIYKDLSDHEAVQRTIARLRDESGGDAHQLEKLDFAHTWYLLDVGDLKGARESLAELSTLELGTEQVRASLVRLEAMIALAEGYSVRAISLALDALVEIDANNETPQAKQDESARATCLELMGSGYANMLAFTEAHDHWEKAGVAYDRDSDAEGAARCALLAAELEGVACANINDAQSMLDAAAQLRGIRDSENEVELKLLRAYVCCRRERENEARELVSALWARRAQFKPRVVARIAMFELMFGLSAEEGRVSECLDAVEAIEPPSLRGTLLQGIERSEASLRLSQDQQRRIGQLFQLDAPHDTWPLLARANRAHLLRIIGQRKRAATFLHRHSGRNSNASAHEEGWSTQCALLALGEPTAFRELLEHAEEDMHEVISLQPWLSAIRIEAALEAVRLGDWNAGHEIAERGQPFEPLRAQGFTAWMARIQEVESYALDHEAPGSRARTVSNTFGELGDLVLAAKFAPSAREVAAAPARTSIEFQAPVAHAPPLQMAPQVAPRAAPSAVEPVAASASEGYFLEIPGTAAAGEETPYFSLSPGTREANVEIAMPVLTELVTRCAESVELTIDTLLGDWHRLAEEMSNCLARVVPTGLEELSFELPPQASALPWELAPFLDRYRAFRRTNKAAQGNAFPMDGKAPRVLLLRPREGGGDISLESISGGSLESLYRMHARRCELQVLFDPSPEEVMDMLRKFQPTIVHINAAVREVYGGIYLDFESTESRTDERREYQGKVTKQAAQRTVASQRRDLVWATTRLARTLEAGKCAATVVLDISAPGNRAETIRALLLRNQFAYQLFQFAPIPQLIAAGLAVAAERMHLTDALIEALVERGPFAVLPALRAFPEAFGHRPAQAGVPMIPDEIADALPRRAAALWSRRQTTSSR